MCRPFSTKQWQIISSVFIVLPVYRTPLLADAILPSLALVWPAFIMLFIPIVVVEALYARRRLQMHLWECLRVLGTANILSSLAGLPIGYALAAGLRYAAEGVYFRDASRLQRSPLMGVIEPAAVTKHDYLQLTFLGLYPRWILPLSAGAMLVFCFLISLWVEAKWVQRYLKNRGQSHEPATAAVWATVRNANLLSYGAVTLFVMWLLMWMWPAR